MKLWEKLFITSALLCESAWRWLYFRWVCWKEFYCPKHRRPLDGCLGYVWCNLCDAERFTKRDKRSAERLRKAGL